MTNPISSFVSSPNENYYIFAGGTKPYHAGHDQLIESIIEDASKDPSGNGKVVIFVGLGSRPPVMSNQVLHVWQTHIEPYLTKKAESLGVPIHIEYGGGPIGKVLAMLKDGSEKCLLTGEPENKFFIYSDPEDTTKNYLEPKFSKRTGQELKSSPPKYYESLLDHEPCPVNFMSIIDPQRFTRGEGTPDISGTAMREAIVQGDFEKFSNGLPGWMDSIASDIYELYRSNIMTNEAISLQNYFSRFTGYKD